MLLIWNKNSTHVFGRHCYFYWPWVKISFITCVKVVRPWIPPSGVWGQHIDGQGAPTTSWLFVKPPNSSRKTIIGPISPVSQPLLTIFTYSLKCTKFANWTITKFVTLENTALGAITSLSFPWCSSAHVDPDTEQQEQTSCRSQNGTKKAWILSDFVANMTVVLAT